MVVSIKWSNKTCWLIPTGGRAIEISTSTCVEQFKEPPLHCVKIDAAQIEEAICRRNLKTSQRQPI